MTINVAGAPKGNLFLSQAHWVSPDTIAWGIDAPEGRTFALRYAADGGLELTPEGVTGGETLALTVDEAGLSEEVLAKFPQLTGVLALKLSEADAARAAELLKGQVVVTAVDADGSAVDATGLQIPGVLDVLYTYDGKLGPVYSADGITLSVWAPTARSVTLHVFADSNKDTESVTTPMTVDPATGVWSTSGSVADWNGKYYLYEVEVYVPKEGRVVKNLVTDPYSVSLSTNSKRSQFVDLADPSLAPEGWAEAQKPPLAAPEDIVIYELHVRDFSVNDPSVPDDLKGTYKAFTLTDSNGMTHLIALAQAGLTHVHLLPVFDLATINENRDAWQGPSFEQLAGFGPAASTQQALINRTRSQDGFNWGYDPFHYNVPEGSYATNPDGSTRIVEFREMVESLNQNGLRVVMDVVYNHTNANGQDDKSVLDQIVPGYYYRLDDNGQVANSTCCSNTATEHTMMEKLMIDSVVLWATQYKVDGFRFDLMGHHMRANMEHVRAALDALTIENSGVDGKAIYLYGEGWDFGEVAQNARGVNATQLNMGGTGIGTFNDRLRDAVRGGSPFGDWQDQGFVSGLSLEPNGITSGTPEEQAVRLLHFSDQIKVGLAGNLRDYTLVNAEGETVTGAEIDYNGNPTGYTLDPQEHIVYAEAHDNQTLFDMIQYKAPEATTVADRVRMQNLGIDIVALSQGVPFFHAGMDMLRSKSMDKNSYDSGDWFNKLDFTYQTNNWGAGLPARQDNEADWPVIQPLLENPNIVPGPDDIMNSVMHFREMLQIRKSSPLFRLQTAAQIEEQVRFFNNGPEQMPGVIVMQIVEGSGGDIDPNYDMVVVIFNATGTDITYTEAQLAGLTLELHPVQVASHDPIVQGSAYDSAAGTFTIPARTTSVFVMPAQ
ncbi:MAG: pullulanase-type alpha-1,6-glucosidase [Chloroflexi bacterium]|nr:pullulanase-type alpha-1,6-glucosidase [Chloroflexota bacterium]